ncbi:37727_t:CDS:2, partial [Gigaspora margarita]
MPRISSKITIGGRVSFKASALPNQIVSQHVNCRGNWKNQRFYGIVIGELNEGGRLKYQVDVESFENTVVDVLAGNLQYEKPNTLANRGMPSNDELLTVPTECFDNSEKTWKKQFINVDQHEIHPSYSQECSVNIEFIRLASPFKLLCRYLLLNYIRQHVINSINIRGRQSPNWVDVSFGEYMRWLGLWVLMSAFPVADHRFYWRTTVELTKPMIPFNFQRWMPLARFEQIVLYHTLMMVCELDTPNLNDPLYSVRSFVDAYNKNLIEAVKPEKTLCIDESMNLWLGSKNKIPGRHKIPRKPHPVGQEWKTVADSSTNIIIQLEPCEDKEIKKKIREWPINYSRDMVQRLESTYGSYFSKVANID